MELTPAVWLVLSIIIDFYKSFIIIYFVFSSLPARYEGYRFKIAAHGSFALFLTLSIIFSLFFKFPYYGLVADFILLLLITGHFLKGTLFKKILVSFVPSAAMAFSEVLTLFLSTFVQNKPMTELVYSHNLYSAISLVLTQMVLTFILLLMLNFMRVKKQYFSKIEWIMLALVSVLSIFVVLMIGLISMNENIDINRIWIMLAAMGAITISIITNIMLVRQSRSNQAELENSLLKQQIKLQAAKDEEIATQYQEIRHFRHDIKNMLNVIRVLSENHEYEEINNYIDKYVKKLNSSKKQVSTNNTYIDAVLNSKLAKAYDERVEVSLNISEVTDSVDPLDMSNLLGNLFDNAIEGCKKCKERRIYFELHYSESDVIILIKNTVEVPVMSNNPELETNKGDKQNHGIGTKIIKNIVKKYHGLCDYYDEGKMFCCGIVLYTD